MAASLRSHNFLDLAGQVFGRLTVIARAEGRPVKWRCRCACGAEKVIRAICLRRGETRSCGCLRRETSGKNAPTVHGLYKTSEHRIWRGLRSRCNDQNNPAYPSYGGRGIRVDPRWDDFRAFLADVGARPSPDHSIERRDNDGPYGPANCYWATRSQQQRNTRRNHLVTIDGKTLPLAAWAEELGLSWSCLDGRIRAGWPPERLREPQRRR